MTVNSVDITDGPYIGNGIASLFDYSFVIQDKNELVVYETNADGVQTLLTVDIDYTVGNIGTDNGSVLRVAGALPTSWQWYIRSNFQATQLTSFNSQGAFFPDLHEKAIDKLTYLVQQVDDKANRSLRFPESYAAGTNGATLPIPDALKLMRWKADLTGLENIDISTLTPGAIVASDLIRKVANFAALVNTGGNLGDRIATLCHTTNGVGAQDYVLLSGSPANDGGRVSPSSVVGRYWQSITFPVRAAHYNNVLATALVNCPDGDIYLDSMVYTPIGFTLTRSNLNIIGASKPWYNPGKTALWGGTIIKGTTAIIGDNVGVSRLGIDAGLDVCNTYYSGSARDALVILDPTRATRYGIVVKNCVALCKDATSAAHNFLMEGLSNSRFEDCTSRYGWWGFVMKTLNSTADGIYSYACSQAGYTFKSDLGVGGSPAQDSTCSNVIIDNEDYPTAANGILLYAAGNNLTHFTLTNFTINKGNLGLKLLCDLTGVGAKLITNVAVSNGSIKYCNNYGLECFGGMSDVNLDNINIQGTVSNKGLLVNAGSNGVHLSNITVDSPALNDDNIVLNGKFTATNIKSFVTADFNTPSGLSLIPDSNNSFKLNGYVGRLRFNGGAFPWVPTFTNLTVVNGTGGATYTGSFEVVGNYIKGQVLVNVTGTATTASTASTTRITNLPFTAIKNGSCQVTSNTVDNHGIGLVQGGGLNCFTPTWAAANNQKIISFEYPIN